MYVSGEVAHAGAYALQGNETVLQMLSEAGGLLPTARGDAIALVRTPHHGQPMVYTLDMERVARGEDAAQNIALQAGDIILVPPSDVTRFDRWVDQHIRLATPLPASVIISNQVQHGSN